MFKNKKVIIFDMDGTLIDSVGIWNEIDITVIRKLTNNPNLEILNIQQIRDGVLAQSTSDDIYLDYCDFLRKTYNSNLSAKEILDLRRKISEEYTKNKIEYKPNADKLLHLLKNMGFKLALATTTGTANLNNYRNFNKNIREKADLDEIFDVIFSKDDVKNKKPNPEVHLKIMNVLKVKPEDCLIIEDALIGVEAAKNAGIEVVTIYDKYSDCDREKINKIANYNFKNFSEILEYIQNEIKEKKE